jgi:hypothetical protein
MCIEMLSRQERQKYYFNRASLFGGTCYIMGQVYRLHSNYQHYDSPSLLPALDYAESSMGPSDSPGFYDRVPHTYIPTHQGNFPGAFKWNGWVNLLNSHFL